MKRSSSFQQWLDRAKEDRSQGKRQAALGTQNEKLEKTPQIDGEGGLPDSSYAAGFVQGQELGLRL